MDLSHILNHLGEDREDYFNAVSPPIMQSVNFCFPDTATMRKELEHEMETPFYTRGYNPGTAILRKKLAALEGTEDAAVFSSGSAAVAAAIMSVVKGGDHIVCAAKPYSWTGTLIGKYLAAYGVTHTYVPGGTVEVFEQALRPETKLVYLESPSSFVFELQDIEAICAMAKRRGITTAVDNSYSSPFNQQPAMLGADMVIHAATKYLGGHSDLVAGVVCGSHARILKMLAEEYMTLGAVVSPHDSWLLIRGLRTLSLRIQRSAETALRVAQFLEQDPRVEKVHYPFLPSHPQYALAKKQMKQGGGLLSVRLKAADVPAMERFCDALKRFLIATSWGGFESLVFPMCALKASTSFEDPLPWNMVRLYIGLEDADILINDLRNALEKL